MQTWRVSWKNLQIVVFEWLQLTACLAWTATLLHSSQLLSWSSDVLCVSNNCLLHNSFTVNQDIDDLFTVFVTITPARGSMLTAVRNTVIIQCFDAEWQKGVQPVKIPSLQSAMGMLTRLVRVETRKNFSISRMEFLAVENLRRCNKQLDCVSSLRSFNDSEYWKPSAGTSL